MPEGHVVTAPADGVIRMVRDDSTRHGCGPDYAWDANYIIVDFENGTEALFLHMKAGSARVSVGQRVQRGEPLAEVGNSGWVCGTHLHFQIQQTCSSWWCPSIPANFTDVGAPERGTTLASNNCPDIIDTDTLIQAQQDQPDYPAHSENGKGGAPTPGQAGASTDPTSKLEITCSQSGNLAQIPNLILMFGALFAWNRYRKYKTLLQKPRQKS